MTTIDEELPAPDVHSWSTEAMKNEQLEFLSDQIRKGIPVGMLEAIAVIEYQTRLRREREYNSMFNRAKRWIKRILGAQKP